MSATAILSEQTLSLSQAAKRLPAGRRGAPVSLACVLRWVMHGATAPNGERVKLAAVRVGGRWITSLESLARFAEKLTPSTDTPSSSLPTLKQRNCAADRAERELEKLGNLTNEKPRWRHGGARRKAEAIEFYK